MTTYYDYLGNAMAVSADPHGNTTSATADGQTVTMPTGPSAATSYQTVNGTTSYYLNDTFVASNGDNTFYVTSPTDLVQAQAGLTGVKTVVSWSTGYVLPDNVQNLTFYGAGNWGIGNGIANLIIMGGNDHNTMDGGGGNDVLVGGLGENDFQYEVAASANHDVFYNFHPNQDTVRIAGANFSSFAQVQAAMTQVTGPDGHTDTVLTLDANNSITFRDTTISQFQASDFLMPLDRSQLGALTFNENFTSLSLFNASTGQGNWQTNFGGDLTSANAYFIQGNDEKQLYTAPGMTGQNGYQFTGPYNPFSINQGGGLDIAAGRFNYADSQHTWGQAYYSGMLNTRGVFMQQYGYFEMKAELPTELGSWPAFWLSQDPYKPGVEADVLEHLGMYGSVNFSRSDQLVNGQGTVTGHTTYMPTLTGFHTYGMLWSPTTTTFYVDDLAVMQVATPASWDKPMYMILDMALGGWGGPIDQSGLPAHMDVDYVHVYGLASSPVNVSEGYATYTAPTGVNTINLIGAAQTVNANNAGDTIVSNNTGNHLIGGAGADTFTLGGGGDMATGGGGSDTFQVNAVPTTAAVVTDFSASDRLDLSGLLSSLNYSGSNAVGDGVIKFTDDGHGDVQVWAQSNSAWTLVATLDGAAARNMTISSTGVVTEIATQTGPVNVYSNTTLAAGQTLIFAGPNDAYDIHGATLTVAGSVTLNDSGANDSVVGVRVQSAGAQDALFIQSGGNLAVNAQGAGAYAYGFYSSVAANAENDGSLSVSAPLFAFGAALAGGAFTNTGTITATSSGGSSYGVFLIGAGQSSTIVNTGTITAGYAIDTAVNAGAVTVRNSGTLNGAVSLSQAAGNQVLNTGSITGPVSFNGASGTQLYDGRGGTHSGDLHFITAAGVTGTDYAYLGNDGETVHGGTANLYVYGGSGADTIVGGTGNTFIDGGAGNNILTGGSGTNTVLYASSAVGVTVSLALQGQAQNTGEGSDTLTRFQNLTGSKFADHLAGDANNNVIDGGGGNDVLDGGGGTDTVSFLSAATGVTVSLALQGQAQNTGVGIDTLSHFQVLQGSSHNDVLEGGGASSNLIGGAGADTFVYRSGDGQVTVADFTASQGDVIDLRAFGTFTSLADVLADAAQSGANTVIQFSGGGSLILDNVAMSALSGADFLLGSPSPSNPPPSGPPPVSTHPLPVTANYDGGAGSSIAFRNAAGDWGYMSVGASGSEVWHAVGPTSAAYANVGVGDFNGDGVADIAFRNPTTGDWGFMTANLSGGETWHAAGATSTQYAAIGTGDFNGDGVADLAFRNTSTGDWGFMTANPAGGETWHAVGATSLAYSAVGVADFNGDGMADIAFRNNATGDLGYMSFTASGGETWHAVGPTGTTYAAIGVGDFDGDGMMDVAFRQASTGDWGYMSVNPGGGETWHGVGPTSTAYAAVQVGDFNGDGQSDIAFRNPTTGDLGYMSVNLSGGETWHALGPTSTDYFVVSN